MKAALVASERGHDVTLYEKDDTLGGQLKHADHITWKWGLKNYKDFLIRELEKSSVKVLVGTEADPEGLKKEGYDAILAACGAVPKTVPVEGAKDPRILAPIDVFGHEDQLGKRVIVIGGASAGTETIETSIGVHFRAILHGPVYFPSELFFPATTSSHVSTLYRTLVAFSVPDLTF